MPQKITKILYVSPLPPPAGGIATLTGILFQKGLGSGYKLACVNTNVIGRPLHAKTTISADEVVRNLRIFFDFFRKMVFFRPHIIHINSSLSRVGVMRDFTCAMIARLAGKKVVTHYHGSIPEFIKGGGLPVRLFNGFIRLSHINIASNSVSRDCLIKAGAGKETAFYLPNFIDEFRFDVAKEVIEGKRSGPKLRALYVGGLTKAKGVFDAVKVAELSENFELTLVSASIGEEFRALMGKLPGNVSFRVGLSHEELVRAYLEHDLFLFLSYHEGFPLSVTEAMAMGLPVLATRVGAVPDMIKEGEGGWLVEPGDIDTVTAIIKTIGNNRQLMTMGLHNRQKVYQNYRFSVVVSQIKDIYDVLRKRAFLEEIE